MKDTTDSGIKTCKVSAESSCVFFRISAEIDTAMAGAHYWFSLRYRKPLLDCVVLGVSATTTAARRAHAERMYK